MKVKENKLSNAKESSTMCFKKVNLFGKAVKRNKAINIVQHWDSIVILSFQ